MDLPACQREPTSNVNFRKAISLRDRPRDDHQRVPPRLRQDGGLPDAARDWSGAPTSAPSRTTRTRRELPPGERASAARRSTSCWRRASTRSSWRSRRRSRRCSARSASRSTSASSKWRRPASSARPATYHMWYSGWAHMPHDRGLVLQPVVHDGRGVHPQPLQQPGGRAARDRGALDQQRRAPGRSTSSFERIIWDEETAIWPYNSTAVYGMRDRVSGFEGRTTT